MDIIDPKRIIQILVFFVINDKRNNISFYSGNLINHTSQSQKPQDITNPAPIVLIIINEQQ